VIPIQSFATGVLAEIVRRQPPSPARTRFAWELAAGQALARATTIDLRDGVLKVCARDRHWAREIERATPIVLARMQHLLGASIRKLEVTAATDKN
jgi:hypothetical protein